jgi:hypothetical protein
MKTILFLTFTLMLAFTSITQSQTCSDKGIYTGPQNSYFGSISSPINIEKPSATNLFNWRLNPSTQGAYFKFNYNSTNSKDLLSPWHVNDPNIQYYSLAKGTNSDYNPTDG